jgi:hypothetical protein
MSILSLVSGCSRARLSEGGLCYFPNENGTYSVLKILKLDDQGVHVRIYSNQFSSPPNKIDESTLFTAGIDRKPNETLGMGHLPLSKKSFEGWKAILFQQSTVKEDELDGYKMWDEAKGGYF